MLRLCAGNQVQLDPTYSNPELLEPRVIRTFPLEPPLWMNSYNLPPFIQSSAYSNFFPLSLESSNKWGSTV